MSESSKVTLYQNKIKAKLSSSISITQNYPDLQNLPQINGVTLVGNKNYNDLSLLSSKESEYPTMNIGDVRDTHYLPVLGETNGKVKLSDIGGTKLSTVSEIPADMAIGDYIFLEKE